MLNLPIEDQEESKHEHALNHPLECHFTAHHSETFINKSQFDFEEFRGDEHNNYSYFDDDDEEIEIPPDVGENVDQAAIMEQNRVFDQYYGQLQLHYPQEYGVS